MWHRAKLISRVSFPPSIARFVSPMPQPALCITVSPWESLTLAIRFHLAESSRYQQPHSKSKDQFIAKIFLLLCVNSSLSLSSLGTYVTVKVPRVLTTAPLQREREKLTRSNTIISAINWSFESGKKTKKNRIAKLCYLQQSCLILNRSTLTLKAKKNNPKTQHLTIYRSEDTFTLSGAGPI